MVLIVLYKNNIIERLCVHTFYEQQSVDTRLAFLSPTKGDRISSSLYEDVTSWYHFLSSEAFGNVILMGCLNAECTITNSPLFNLTIFIFVL
jgi:hypothetical protein